MSVESVLEASRLGMTYERLRLDAASKNIASANQPLAPGMSATKQVVFGSVNGFQSHLNVQGAAVSTRDVYDPGNPAADTGGFVHYPQVDLVNEMTTLITASRGYEANVRSFNMIRGMVLKALEIGAK